MMSDCHNHTCTTVTSSVCQTLDELDFERGIWFAAQYGDLDRVKKLLLQGTHIDVRDNAGYTALHYAARSGHLEMCKFLLSKGANINAITKSGQATSLHRATTAGNFEIFEYLINNGADIKLKDSDGKTVLHRAAESQNTRLLQEILKICPELKNEEDCRGNVALNYIHSEEIKKIFLN